jgi:hypothetical protein
MCFGGGGSSPPQTYQPPPPPPYEGDTTRVERTPKEPNLPVFKDDPAKPRPVTNILTDTEKKTAGKTILGS